MSSADLVGRLERVVLQCGNEWYYTPLVCEALAEIKRLSKELAETQGHLAIRNSDLLDEQLRHGRTAQAARRELAAAESRALSIEAETRERLPVIDQHIGWLKMHLGTMTEANWRDMKLYADRQLEELETETDRVATAIRASASTPKGERSCSDEQ